MFLFFDRLSPLIAGNRDRVVFSVRSFKQQAVMASEKKLKKMKTENRIPVLGPIFRFLVVGDGR